LLPSQSLPGASPGPVHARLPKHSPVLVRLPSNNDPIYLTFRANPFPEVTDLICRVPLSTLSHQLEAVHLGDLLRLWVRPDVRTNPSCRFSRSVRSSPDATEVLRYCMLATLSPDNLISGSTHVKTEKRTLPRAPSDVSAFCYVTVEIPHSGTGISTSFSFARGKMNLALFTELPLRLESTHPCPTAVHTEPFPTSVFKVLI